jgi:hypothetical protein
VFSVFLALITFWVPVKATTLSISPRAWLYLLLCSVGVYVAHMAGARRAHDKKVRTGTFKVGDEKWLDISHNTLGGILGLRADFDPQKDKAGYQRVVAHLQHVLGIEKLTHLRDSILQRANEHYDGEPATQGRQRGTN